MLEPTGHVPPPDLGAIAAMLAGVPTLPPHLPGWESLCAAEYARAVGRIDAALATARSALDRARWAA